MITGILTRAAAKRQRDFPLHRTRSRRRIRPAGVLANVMPIPATGDAIVDLYALVEAYTGDFDTATFLTTPSIAVSLAMLGARARKSTFVDLSAKGGQLFGLPMHHVHGRRRRQQCAYVILADCRCDPSRCRVNRSLPARHATVEMDNDADQQRRDGDRDTQVVSLWQTDSIGIKVAARDELERDHGQCGGGAERRELHGGEYVRWPTSKCRA